MLCPRVILQLTARLKQHTLELNNISDATVMGRTEEQQNRKLLQNVVCNVKMNMTDSELQFTHLSRHVAGVVVSDGMLRFCALSCAYKLARPDHNGLNSSTSATHTSRKMKQLMGGFLKERKGR